VLVDLLFVGIFPLYVFVTLSLSRSLFCLTYTTQLHFFMNRYLETYGSALHLEASDGSKVKLKEYLLSDEMMSLLNNFQGERLRLVLVKAGHDRKYSIIVDA
jgi:hypothetical protein